MTGKRSTAFSLGELATSAAQVLTPNSLQFNEDEFQRSPNEAQDAAREAARLVKPGDLIFMTTSGLVYSMGRYLTDNAYDHVVVVLDDHTALHVGVPSVKPMPLMRLLLPQRQPVVLRVQMSETESQLFLRCARQLIGCKYDVARAYKLMVRLVLKRMFGTTPLPRLPHDIKSNAWICSDSVLYVILKSTIATLYAAKRHSMVTSTYGLDSVLLAGCCQEFREALAQARQETDLDIFTLGSASLTDFQRIRRMQPALISRVPLPVVNYTLVPRKLSWQAYIPDLIRFTQHVQNRKWLLLAPANFPNAHKFATSFPSTSWPVQHKFQVLGYTMVLLLLFRRGLMVKQVLMQTIEVLIMRYIAHHVTLHSPSFSVCGNAKL